MINAPLTQAERETLILLADNRMSVAEVARECYYSRKTIYDRIRTIKAKTGIDPLDFWGLHRLLTIAENEKEEEERDKGRTDGDH